MAQNEGRTLRRAPRLSLSQLLLFVVMLFVALTFGMAVHGLKAAAESALVTETGKKTVPNTNLGAAANSQSARSEPTITQVGTPMCTPAKYRLPTPINLAGLPVGVTAIEDSVQRYTVYGSTAEQRFEQLQHCAPDGEYAGAASYQVTWQYGYTLRSDGLCQLVQPKIGLHLTMILPTWQAVGASPDDTAAWGRYIRALESHEQGHYAISKEYANSMLRALENLPAQQCGIIKTAADTALQMRLNQLNAAQSNYDAMTNHGATQGATL